MKEKKIPKKIILIPIVLVLIAAVTVACDSWMRTPGIHFMLGFMRADIKDTCYIYDSDKDEFLGQTEVMIKGRGNGITKKFRGEISVDGYAIEEELPEYTPIHMIDSIWQTEYAGFWKIKKDKNGEEYLEAAFSKYSYYLRINTKNSREYMIAVSNTEDNDCPFMIHAASEKEARKLFQKFCNIMSKEATVIHLNESSDSGA